MKKPRTSHLSAAAAAAIAVGTAGTLAATGGARPAPVASPAATRTTMLTDVTPGFDPVKVTVKAGTEMVWKAFPSNSDYHTVTLDDRPRKARGIDSGVLGPGQSFKRRLTVKGTYFFVCKRHAGMFQTVKVR